MLQRNVIAFVVSLAACAVGCTDKKASPPAATLPLIPPGSGITLRADGDATVVTDTVGGYALRVPGELSKIDTDPAGSAGGRPAVSMFHDLPQGFLMVQVAPVRADQAPTTPALLTTFYAGVQAAMVGSNIGGGAVADLVPQDVTIAGHPGRRLDARLDAGKKQGHVSSTTVVIPEKLVAYTFLVVDGDAAAITDPAPVYTSLHATSP